MNTQEIVNGLNDLLKRNYDAEAGYKQVMENTDSPRLNSYFKDQAQQRYSFGHEIKDLIHRMGGSPDKGTSMKGDIHRGWINFKSMISTNDEKAMLKECERGEQSSVETYDEFLDNHNPPHDIKNAIKQQRNKILGSLTRVEELEEVY